MNTHGRCVVTEAENRRPLRVRDTRLARRFAAWLSQRNVTPNRISLTSVIFALASAGEPGRDGKCEMAHASAGRVLYSMSATMQSV